MLRDRFSDGMSHAASTVNVVTTDGCRAARACRDYFGSLFTGHGLQPTVAYRSASFETVRSMVGNGLGYSILVTKPGNAMSYDGHALALRSLTEEVTPGRSVIAQAEAEANPKATDFVEHCRALLFGAVCALKRTTVVPTHENSRNEVMP